MTGRYRGPADAGRELANATRFTVLMPTTPPGRVHHRSLAPALEFLCQTCPYVHTFSDGHELSEVVRALAGHRCGDTLAAIDALDAWDAAAGQPR